MIARLTVDGWFMTFEAKSGMGGYTSPIHSQLTYQENVDTLVAFRVISYLDRRTKWKLLLITMKLVYQ